MSSPEPILKPTPIVKLRPTQITVGMREVDLKRVAWRETSPKKAQGFFARHMIPVVIGPKGRFYVIDHHHLALALHLEGVEDALVSITADLGELSPAAFWTYLDNVHWCHPYDGAGRRQVFDAIPGAVSELADDPFRSLSGALRRAGGYAKSDAPFSEFIWADFLRRRIKRKLVEGRFEKALDGALLLAKSKEAGYLPGWCGPDPTN